MFLGGVTAGGGNFSHPNHRPDRGFPGKQAALYNLTPESGRTEQWDERPRLQQRDLNPGWAQRLLGFL
jgi:hypothetical protein